MNNNVTSTDINMNNSSVQLKPKSINQPQQYNNSFLNQLNSPQNNINNEETLSTKANMNEEENKNLDVNSIKSNSQLNEPNDESQNIIKKGEINKFK